MGGWPTRVDTAKDTSLLPFAPGRAHLVTVVLDPAESDLKTAVRYGRNHSRILESVCAVCVPKLLCIILTKGGRRPGRDRENDSPQ